MRRMGRVHRNINAVLDSNKSCLVVFGKSKLHVNAINTLTHFVGQWVIHSVNSLVSQTVSQD